jgi:hypothetical protein
MQSPNPDDIYFVLLFPFIKVPDVHFLEGQK